jgi:flagellar biosynthesis chaperone FliJ
MNTIEEKYLTEATDFSYDKTVIKDMIDNYNNFISTFGNIIAHSVKNPSLKREMLSIELDFNRTYKKLQNLYKGIK